MPAQTYPGTGRTSIVGIAAKNIANGVVWGQIGSLGAQNVTERLHAFATFADTDPKELNSKGAGDDYLASAMPGDCAGEVELHGDVGYGGMRTVFSCLSGVSQAAGTILGVSSTGYTNTFVPASNNTTYASIEGWDGQANGARSSVGTAMMHQFSLEQKAGELLKWSAKFHADRVSWKSAASEAIMTALTYPDPQYIKKIAHWMLRNEANQAGYVRLARIPLAAADAALGSANEIWVSDFKFTIDLKAKILKHMSRFGAAPIIDDLPDMKVDFTVPALGTAAGVDPNGVISGLIDDAGTRQAGEVWNPATGGLITGGLYKMELYWESPDQCASIPAPTKYSLKLQLPAIYLRVKNPAYAASGLMPVKVEGKVMKPLVASAGMAGLLMPWQITTVNQYQGALI